MRGRPNPEDKFRPHIDFLRRHRVRLRPDIMPVIAAWLYCQNNRYEKLYHSFQEAMKAKPMESVRVLMEMTKSRMRTIEQLICDLADPIDRNTWYDGEKFAEECAGDYIQLADIQDDGPDPLAPDIGGEGGP